MEKPAYVRFFEEFGAKDVPLVGGKNASLAEMYRALSGQRVRVPHGFAVTASAYRHVLVRAARQADADQLVIGSRHRSRWPRLPNESTVADEVLRAAGGLPVQVVNVGRQEKASHEWPRPRQDAGQDRRT
jgi:phosphoenolpyruvate synthase/pyruvate phosphate dikinase